MLSTVKVPPPKSSTLNLPTRARLATSAMATLRPWIDERVRVADHRHDEALVDGDRDAHVDPALGHQPLLGPDGVEGRVALQCLGDRLDDERDVAEPDPLLRLVRALGLVTNRHQVRDVDLHLDVRVWRLQGTRHLRGDALAHLRGRDEDLIGAFRERDRRGRRQPASRSRGRRCGRGGCARGRGGGSCACGRGRDRGPGPDRFDDLEHVLAGDPATTAGAGDLGRRQVVLAQQPTDGRGHAGIRIGRRRWRDRRGGGRDRCGRCGGGHLGGTSFVAAGRPGGDRGGRSGVGVGRRRRGCIRPRRSGRRSRLGRGGGGRRARSGPVVGGLDHRDLGVVGDGRPFLDQDLAEDALERGRDLGVHLVGDDLDERLVLVDVVARLLEPLPDRPLGDALAELGHRHLRHVRRSSGVGRFGGSLDRCA